MAKICPVCNMATLQMPAEGSDEKPYCTNCRWHIDMDAENDPPMLPSKPFAPSAVTSILYTLLIFIDLLIAGVFGFLFYDWITMLFVLRVLFALLAVFFGIEALAQIRNKPDVYKGSAFAVTGIICGGVVIATVVLLFFPGFLKFVNWIYHVR